MVAWRVVAEALVTGLAFLAVLGAGWAVSLAAGRGASALARRAGYYNRTEFAAGARAAAFFLFVLVACAVAGISALAVIQLLLLGIVTAAAVAAGIAFGHAGKERAAGVLGRPRARSRSKPLPQLGSQFESNPAAADAIMYGEPEGHPDWVPRGTDRRAPKPRFDWALIERRVQERRAS